MTHLSERIAADVLKASGSGLQNYTMNGSRERIIAAASVADDLLEGLQHAVAIIKAHVDRDALGMGGDPRDGQWPLLDEYLHHMRAAIAKALGEQA